MTKEDLERIDAHLIVLYLIGPGGSLDNARSMMDFGAGLVKAGGLAVKVETAGAGHSPAEWFRMGDKKTVADLFRAYVIVATGAETTYSCGMHNLGYRDAVITGTGEEDAYRLVTIPLLYARQEQPVLNSGETFSLTADSPYYRLKAEPCSKFGPTVRSIIPTACGGLHPSSDGPWARSRNMPSPYPGMDPYLESWIWGDFHSNLISALVLAQLNAKLPRRHIANTELFVCG